MKKLFILILFAFAVSSCEHKELWYGVGERQEVKVIFDWQEDAVKPTAGMRINLFSINAFEDYGRTDMSFNGGTVYLPVGGEFTALCYNYHGNQMLFSDQENIQQIRVSCAQLLRSTYNRSYPSEPTYTQPDADIFADRVSPFEVYESKEPIELVYKPVNIIRTYTFEVHNVVGAEFITDVRGAISGMSNGYYLAAETYFPDPVTVFFTAKVNKTNKIISGSFRTFSRQDMTNIFTLEILFPSSDGRIIQKSYDVTAQTEIPDNYHIYIADSGIDVPDESGEGSDGWDVDVKDWGDVDVPL